MYRVKEIFKTLQGEGGQVGRVMVFVRFSGCNLWSGREKDRAKAVCKFCDTDFVGGKRFNSSNELAGAIETAWGAEHQNRYVLFTGGEPALQIDESLIMALRERSFRTGIETNGTVKLPDGIDWVCVSPKAGTEIVQRVGDELKVVFPQEGMMPHQAPIDGFRICSLQPMDGPQREANTREAVSFCLANPRWSLSLQTHKMIGIP